MNVAPGSQDVTTYFAMWLVSTGGEATGLAPTDFDLQYVRSGVAPSVKVDATALASAGATHVDNSVIEVDATDQPGLYRIDWPDAAFASGAREVLLTAKCAAAWTETLRVALDPVPYLLSAVSDATPAAGDFTGATTLSVTDNFYQYQVLSFTTGALQGLARQISQYVGGGRQFLFTGTGENADAPFPAPPANGDSFMILGRIGT